MSRHDDFTHSWDDDLRQPDDWIDIPVRQSQCDFALGTLARYRGQELSKMVKIV